MIFRTLVAYLLFFQVLVFFFQETHTLWSQKVNLWAAILGVLLDHFHLLLSLRHPAARQFCRTTYTITDITYYQVIVQCLST
jgi:hypothetical protein